MVRNQREVKIVPQVQGLAGIGEAETEVRGTGRIKSPIDIRDLNFRLGAVRRFLPRPEKVVYSRHYALPAILPIDQGQTPRCTGYSTATLAIAGPVKQKVLADYEHANAFADAVYHRAQVNDNKDYGWPVDENNGATIRSTMKAGVEIGLYGSYLWGFTVDEIVEFLLHHGPVELGIVWDDQMSTPDERGWIHVDTKEKLALVDDGHAISAVGVDRRVRAYDGTKGGVVLAQTWGRGWGIKGGGTAWLSFADLAKLMLVGGECAMPLELKLPVP